MWITPPCGSIFRCNADRHDVGPDPAQQRGAFVRCGSRYFRPAPGQTRLNCSCTAAPQKTKAAVMKHFGEPAPRRSCGGRAIVDSSGGVSAAFRRLPEPKGANPAVRCCRNKPASRGGIDWNVTLNSTQRDYAAWPAACEALCETNPGRCNYFSHSFRFQSESTSPLPSLISPYPPAEVCARCTPVHGPVAVICSRQIVCLWSGCITCATCVPEVLLGDDTWASFQRTTEDPATLYTPVLA